MKFKEVFQKIFVTLFPTARSYVNFCLMWVFLVLVCTPEKPLVVLVSALGTIYCLNEWGKNLDPLLSLVSLLKRK